MRIVILLAAIVALLLPSVGFSLTDGEVFDLLIQRSLEIKKFPFHVYVMPDYAGFQGVPLPVSSYAFFAPIYEVLKSTERPGEIFATFHFSQGTRWKCFLLRVPGMYAIERIDMWVFDTESSKWQEPIKLAESWGDAGYSISLQAWIENVNKDSLHDIVVKTLETDIDLDAPHPIKRKDTIYVWDKDHFKDGSSEYLRKMKLEKYQFKEYRYEREE